MRVKTSVSVNICDHEGESYAAVAKKDGTDLHHNQWLLTFQGKLGLSPKVEGSAKRAWDAGTGMGLWAKGATLKINARATRCLKAELRQ
ncbi:hypothetical protein BGZ61DRAFT_464358 [Ilyonectria robusta]|uniref:uncharacterized protein n=1 Tax=Ilyonectria robusta TaxID=1079257 RepID=UPI001E8E7175|nr:uncharacterized protein BGZ61DRAFT_464358 [Ilyonectria robusta]KAH8661195.1 hypothetical protein BGZ61DRAFT_464358 [Ilyonectria robusta]